MGSGGGKGGGGGGGGSSAASLSVPPGFRRTLRDLGQNIFRPFINDPRFAEGLSGALDFYSGLPRSPDVQNSLGVYRQDIADPMRLTDPLFLSERERLGAELIERGRQTGGLQSSATDTLLGTGLGEFTNRYLTDAYTRREAAASNLFGQTLGLGQAMFTPFQAITGAMSGLIGRGNVQPQQPYSNSKGQFANTLGQLGAAYLNRNDGA